MSEKVKLACIDCRSSALERISTHDAYRCRTCGKIVSRRDAILAFAAQQSAQEQKVK